MYNQKVFMRPGTASTFKPKLGTAKACKTSVEHIESNIGFSAGNINLWSVATKRGKLNISLIFKLLKKDKALSKIEELLPEKPRVFKYFSVERKIEPNCLVWLLTELKASRSLRVPIAG